MKEAEPPGWGGRDRRKSGLSFFDSRKRLFGIASEVIDPNSELCGDDREERLLPNHERHGIQTLDRQHSDQAALDDQRDGDLSGGSGKPWKRNFPADGICAADCRSRRRTAWAYRRL